MMIFLILLPFGVFSALMLLASADLALFAAAATGLAVIAYDRLRGRQLKMLGAGSVALGPGSADPFGPKAVRASMGAIFSVPVTRITSVAELPSPTIALAARTGEALRDNGARHLCHTLVVGAERDGLPTDVLAACDETAHIPIHTESLNAAMAAAIALYEVTRVAQP